MLKSSSQKGHFSHGKDRLTEIITNAEGCCSCFTLLSLPLNLNDNRTNKNFGAHWLKKIICFNSVKMKHC